MDFNPALVIIFTLIIAPFSLFLWKMGKRLFSITSYKKYLEDYKKDPTKFDWFDHYVIGLKVGNDKMIGWVVNHGGDGIMSGWSRISGVLACIFSVLMGIGLIGIWIINLFFM